MELGAKNCHLGESKVIGGSRQGGKYQVTSVPKAAPLIMEEPPWGACVCVTL